MLIKPIFWWCCLVIKERCWIKMVLILFLEDLNLHKISLAKDKTMIQSILDWPQKLLTIILISTSPIMIHNASLFKTTVKKVTIHNRHGERVHRIKIFCNREMESNYLETNLIVTRIWKAILRLLMLVRSLLFSNHRDKLMDQVSMINVSMILSKVRETLTLLMIFHMSTSTTMTNHSTNRLTKKASLYWIQRQVRANTII